MLRFAGDFCFEGSQRSAEERSGKQGKLEMQSGVQCFSVSTQICCISSERLKNPRSFA